MDRMILILKSSPEQESQLRTLLDSQQSKGSPHYHRWLTPDEFGQMFGPSAEDIDQVKTWLEGQGFSVGQIPHGRRWMEFSGTASQVESAFQTQMRRYQMDGISHIANASDISIPAALAPVVRGVVSLNDFFRTTPRATRHFQVQTNPLGVPTVINPEANLNGDNGPYHALAPGDFAIIYNLTPLYSENLDGSGQTIAIVSESDIQLSDVQTFREMFSLPPNDPMVTKVNGQDPGQTNAWGEATLDTEWAGAVAPGATLNLVVSDSAGTTPGQDFSAMYIVEYNQAGTMTDSYGSANCEGNMGPRNEFYNSLWQQASAQGISVFVASGDSGAAGCDPHNSTPNPASGGLAVGGVASTPFDTAVGGTEFDEGANEQVFWSMTNALPGFTSVIGYIPEVVWSDNCDPTVQTCDNNEYYIDASEGGISILYPKPLWQLLSLTGAVDPKWRDVPDVSLAAGGGEHDGHIICWSGDPSGPCTVTLNSQGAVTGFHHAGTSGGTSAAAPAFAGIMAIINQKYGGRQGLANYTLYQLAANEVWSNCNSSNRTNPSVSSPCIFNDITVGNNDVPGQVGYPAQVGYDLATGLGSVNAANLVNAWNSVTSQGSTPPFYFSADSAVSTVNAGGTATFGLHLFTSGGFAGPISLSCSGAPCAVFSASGSNVVYGNGGGGNFAVTVSVPTSQQAFAPLGLRGSLPVIFAAVLMVMLLTINKRRKLAFLALMVVLLVSGLGACSQSRSISTVTVTGTSGTMSNSISLTVTVIH
jgi:subtilase family serine protease